MDTDKAALQGLQEREDELLRMTPAEYVQTQPMQMTSAVRLQIAIRANPKLVQLHTGGTAAANSTSMAKAKAKTKTKTKTKALQCAAMRCCPGTGSSVREAAS